MSEWDNFDPNKARLALEDVYMMARIKRAKRHRYDDAGNFLGLIGPKSDDEDWDRVIQFCERAGLRASILRTMAANASRHPSSTDWSTYEGDDDMPYDPDDGSR